MSDRFFPPSRPRQVEGGLKARSARGAIGQSWWSRRFLAVLESFALGTRLTRGRSYARKGQVISLDVAPGEVLALVQGSRVKPYRVRIGFARLPELAWARVEIALAEQALHSAKLLAGEVPAELEQVFTEADAALFPTSVRELDQRCSCPDREVPCKHIAATFYLLAESFDIDPFLILRWRGRDRDALLTRLRTLRCTDTSSDAAESATGSALAVPVGTALALSDLPAATATDLLDRFWIEPVPLSDQPATLDIEPGLILRQLPTPGPVLGGDQLLTHLRGAYDHFGQPEPSQQPEKQRQPKA